MSEITRHFTSTTFVVFDGRTLLHFHKSLKMWLPPGGHIERDELPHECAVREVREETGLDVVLAEDSGRVNGGITKVGVTELPSPRYILLEDINPHHQHIDLIWFARARTGELSPGKGESTRIRWFDLGDIDSSSELTEDIRVLAREALKELSTMGPSN